MNVLDLFAGLRGWSDSFKARGHNTYTVELAPRFEADFRDVLEFRPARDLPWKPDIILASPPCTSFSMMSVGTHWTHDGEPKSDTARMGKRLVERTLEIIAECEPRWFVIENPRARLRSLPFLTHLERRTVSYCQLGEKRMKPTDLWGGFPPCLTLPALCKNGAPCHIPAPRGSRTGTQGMNRVECAKIPRALSLLVCEAAERAISSETQTCDWWVDGAKVSRDDMPELPFE